MGRKPLSEEEVRARFEFAKTHSYEEFAREFGCTVNSARTWFSHNKIKPPRQPLPLDDKEAIEYAKGHTRMELAEHYGVTYNTACSFVINNGITPVPESPWRRAVMDRDEMIKYLADKFTLDAIGKVFGLTRQRVSQIANKEYSNDESV